MSGAAITRERLRVTGTVQGVGFRPFVYRHAVALGLAGIAAGVTSLVQKRNTFFGTYLLAGIVGLVFSIYY
ncbi:MAG: acylphosphatase, partial [Ilumatobacteraceae bacterium]